MSQGHNTTVHTAGAVSAAVPPMPQLYLVSPDSRSLHAADALHTACGPILSGSSEITVVPFRCGTHTLDPDAIEYLDGLIVSYCITCRERCEIRWVPGGTGALMLRFVAETILSYVDAGADIPPELIERLLDAHGRVTADHELIEDSMALYQTLRRVIERL